MAPVLKFPDLVYIVSVVIEVTVILHDAVVMVLMLIMACLSCSP